MTLSLVNFQTFIFSWASCLLYLLTIPFFHLSNQSIKKIYAFSTYCVLNISISEMTKSVNSMAFFFFFNFFWRESTSRGERQRGGRETERPRAHEGVSQAQSHDPGIVTGAEINNWTLNQLSHLGAPDNQCGLLI